MKPTKALQRYIDGLERQVENLKRELDQLSTPSETAQVSWMGLGSEYRALPNRATVRFRLGEASVDCAVREEDGKIFVSVFSSGTITVEPRASNALRIFSGR